MEQEATRRFSASELARIQCEKCSGCGECCHGMGESIRLDPWDIDQLTRGLGKSFEELQRDGVIGLHTEEGLILPHMQMRENGDGACSMLAADGRCSIHPYRSGYCRLFPLGRDYDAETRSFRYFIVDNGCAMPGKQKVKISRWLGIENLRRYEQFVCDWHYYCRDVKAFLALCADPDYGRQLNLFLLKVFYVTPYGTDGADFYARFDRRLEQARGVLS